MFRFKLVGKVLLWSFIYNIIPKHHQTTFYITYNTIFIVCHQNQQSCREGGGEGGINDNREFSVWKRTKSKVRNKNQAHMTWAELVSN